MFSLRGPDETDKKLVGFDLVRPGVFQQSDEGYRGGLFRVKAIVINTLCPFVASAGRV
jgi:hypothetical protein